MKMDTKTYLIRFEIHDGESEYLDDSYVRADSYDAAFDYAQEELKTFWEDAETHYDDDGNIDYVESAWREARLYTVAEFKQLRVFNLSTGQTEYIDMQPSEETLYNK